MDFSDLNALYINCTLKRSPESSHTEGLAGKSIDVMREQGVTVDLVRAVDLDLVPGVQPDMTEHYGRAGGCIVTGNEDGAKHCAMNVLYSLQHLGFTISPQADAAWLGGVGPGPSYLDEGSGGPQNDFTNRNTHFMSWNLMHVARMLKDAGGFPARGNSRTEWDAGTGPDHPNPEHRS